MHSAIRNNKIWYLILAIAIPSTLLLQYCAKYQILPFTNYYIPDSVHYELNVFNEKGRGGLSDGFDLFNSWIYFFGPQSFTLYNSLVLFGALYFCRVFEDISPKAVYYARASIVLNPYLLLSIAGPTKECNLTFFALGAIYFFLKGSAPYRVLGILMGVLPMFIRPQFGMLTLIGLSCYLALKVIKSPVLLCLLILSTYFFLNAIPAVNSFLISEQGEGLQYYQTSNFYAIALVLLEMSKNPLLQIVGFFIKVVLVMFVPVVRPNPIGTVLPLLDVGYTFMAYFLFPLNFAFILLFFNGKRLRAPQLSIKIQLLIVYCFIGIMSVIISSMMQFRYLFPYLPIMAACFYLHNVKVRNRIIALSMLVVVIAFVGTFLFFPKAMELEFDTGPFFVSWL